MGKSVYVVALIATLAIFAVVFFMVRSFEDERFNSLNEQLRQFVLESELQGAYAAEKDIDSVAYCSFLQNSIKSNSSNLSLLEYRLQNYKETLFSSNFVLVKRSYLLTNLLLLEHISQAESVCKLDIKPVIYFYAEDKSCEIDCGVVSNQLEIVKRECPSVWVFALPFNWPEYNFTSFVEKKYGITKPATLVINGKVLEYPQKKEDLLKELGC
jgi:hypothetical protein